MKKLFLTLSAAWCAGTALYAGTHNPANSLPQNPDHGKVPVPAVFTHLNRSLSLPGNPRTKTFLAPAIPQNKTAALIWQLVGDRRDYYSAAHMGWDGNDSTVYQYTPAGLRTAMIQFDTVASGWQNDYKHTYTLGLAGNVVEDLGQTWDDVGNAWVNDSRNQNIYTPSGDTLQVTDQVWDVPGAAWLNDSRLTNTYDANGLRTYQLTEDWDDAGSVWVNTSRLQKIYDASNRVTENIYQDWDDVGGIWVNTAREVFAYTSGGLLNDRVYQNWNAGSSAWANATHTVFTYTSIGLVSTLTDQHWDGVSSWINYEQFTYSYDAADRLSEKMYLSWDNNTSLWTNVVKDSYTYNAANLQTLYQSQMWNGNAWDNYFKQENDYNGTNQLTRFETYMWSGTAWVSGNRYSGYTYDANGNLTYDLGEVYNSTTAVYNLYSRDFYYYASFNTTGMSQVKNDLGVKVYPNPLGQTLFIEGKFRNGERLQGQLSDAAGRVLQVFAQPAHEGERISVALPTLTPGLYFLSLTDNTGAASVIKLAK